MDEETLKVLRELIDEETIALIEQGKPYIEARLYALRQAAQLVDMRVLQLAAYMVPKPDAGREYTRRLPYNPNTVVSQVAEWLLTAEETGHARKEFDLFGEMLSWQKCLGYALKRVKPEWLKCPDGGRGWFSRSNVSPAGRWVLEFWRVL